MSRVNRNHARLPGRAEGTAVVLVDHRAAGEDHDSVLLGQGNGQLPPMQQVRADRVTPAHVAPFVAKRVVLEKQVVLTLEVNQAVRVVRPMLARRKVVLGTKWLVVSRRNRVCS